jgi:hypothetical protein
MKIYDFLYFIILLFYKSTIGYVPTNLMVNLFYFILFLTKKLSITLIKDYEYKAFTSQNIMLYITNHRHML